VTTLDQSVEFCRDITRREARNFYFSFLTLPRKKRDAMCAIYTWMRKLDDFADDALSPTQARIAVERWVAQTHLALRGEPLTEKTGADDLWPAFVETVQRYSIPPNHFDEIAKGALMDQEVFRYETFEDLYAYCYRVASLVGLVSLRVFEYPNKEAEQTGEALGIAFQLTNILRDVAEDGKRGRLYIPLEDLRKYGVSEKELLDQRWSDSVQNLFKAFAERAEGYYIKARPVVDQVSKEARPTLAIMTEIYHGILKNIQEMDFQVFHRRARVPTWKKFWIVAKHQYFK
jgi:15-cis-phytoene synthase